MDRGATVLRIAAASLLGIAMAAYAYAGQPADHTAFNGGWTLNKELSSTPAAPGQGSGERGGTGRRGGGPGGGEGFPPGGGGGFGGRGGGGFGGPGGGGFGGQAADPDAMRKRMEVMREVMESPTHLIVTVGEGTVTFVQADGRSQRFTTDGKKEKHQLQSATIETKTKWDGASLRQELDLGDGQKMVRTFSVPGDTGQLTVAATLGDDGNGRRPPVRLVYDHDAR
jgi:hypothetical protein